MKYKLSVLIPARNEEFLKNTIEDILKNREAETEIIVGLDGEWSNPPLDQSPDVTVVYYPESIGQRAMTNRLCKLSKAKYVMKADAHCAFDKGFDRKLIEDMQDDWTVVPIMKNLHAFSWRCKKCGNEWYQGPTPTECRMKDPKEEKGWIVNKNCDSKEFEKVIKWNPNPSPNSTSYRFNKQLEFKYFGEYERKQEGNLVETMSLQGSCFMMTREKYWELNICDESWGSWGGQGAEVAIKTWLSGGRVICNKKTWYAHLFRTQGGDFGFPYSNPGNEQKKAKDNLRKVFLNDKWDKAIRPLSWIIEKFNPPEWGAKKGIVYYTCNTAPVKIARKCQAQLKKIGLPIVSVSLKPMDFGENIVLNEERGHLTMFKQILAGLKASTADIIFFAEHDVLYHPSHFEFTPPKKDVYFYNLNVWKLREDGLAVKVDDCKQTSGLCAYRELLIGHYERRIAKILQNQEDLAKEGKPIKNDGYSRHMGYEPGGHSEPRGVDNYKREGWSSEFPNVDIRHNNNFTPSRWSKDEFRDQKYAKGWKEAREIEGWGATKDLII